MGNILGGWGFRIKGAGPFWGAIRGILINLLMNPLHGQNTVIFGRKHLWGEEI